MSIVTCDLAVSVDSYVAGPNQSSDNPIGEGGLRLHEWHFDPKGVDKAITEEWQTDVGAYIMGRNMFGGGDGAWDETWTGWWGEDVGDPKLDPITVVASPAVTHVKYRVVH